MDDRDDLEDVDYCFFRFRFVRGFSSLLLGLGGFLEVWFWVALFLESFEVFFLFSLNWVILRESMS